MISSPSELLSELSTLFPDFDFVLDEREALDCEGDNLTYHYIMSSFCSSGNVLLAKASTRQTKIFCALIDLAMKQGGKLENAITTCLLEHASQVGIFQVIRPYLSSRENNELR